MRLLEGKTAVITGGVRGIGKAVAKIFVENGAKVVLVYRSNEEAAEKTAAELKEIAATCQKDGTAAMPAHQKEGAAAITTSQEEGVEATTASQEEEAEATTNQGAEERVLLVKGDVVEEATAQQAVALCKETFGRVDILVNNAGITRDKLLIKMSSDDFEEVMDANLTGSFHFLKAAGTVMMKQKSGSIINMSSIAGVVGNPGQINYSASKAGIIGMTKSAAKELGRRSIRVNAIAPGFIETDMTAALTDEQKEKAAATIALARLGQPEDIAKAALFLASDMSTYVTGQVLGVDGGLVI